MAQDFDPHCFNNAWKKAQQNIEALSEPNKSLIKDFVDNYRHKKKPLGLKRKLFLARFLLKLQKHCQLKPFSEKQISESIKAMQGKETANSKAFSLQTWREYTKNLKIWTKWTNPKNYFTILQASKDDLSVQDPYDKEANAKRKQRLDEFLVTEENFAKLLQVGNVMQKALLAVGYGCGCRAGEALGLRWKDVKFNSDKTAELDFIESKTFARHGVLLEPSLAFYLAQYANFSNKEKNSFVFGNNGNSMSEKNLQDNLHALAIKTGLGKIEKIKSGNGFYKRYSGKRLNWTMLRRAAITWGLQSFKNPSLAAKRYWGNESSSMIKVYSGMMQSDANAAYRIAAGLTAPEENKKALKQRNCWKCGNIYPIEVQVCPDCQLPISVETLISQKEMEHALQLKEMEIRLSLVESMMQKKKN